MVLNALGSFRKLIRKSEELCVQLCRLYNQKYICTPKFTHAVINEVCCQAIHIISLALIFQRLCATLQSSLRCLFLLVLYLLLHLGICVSAKQSRLEETIKDDLKKAIFKNEKLNKVTEKEEELMQRMERTDISWKMEKEHLENELETKNVEVENLQQQLKEMKVQFAEIESRVEDIATFKSEMRAEVRKELDKVLPTVVEQGLRDLTFEMVCAFKNDWLNLGVVTYDKITV